LVVSGVETAFDAGSGLWMVDVSDTGVSVTTSAGTVSVAATVTADRVAFVGAVGLPAFESQWRSPYVNELWVQSSGICTDMTGNVYVAARFDNNSGAILKFDAAGNQLEPTIFEGSGPEEFQFAADVAVDASGNIYVVDLPGARVQKYDPLGDYLMTI